MMNHPADTLRGNAINRVEVSLLQQTFCSSVEIHFHALASESIQVKQKKDIGEFFSDVFSVTLQL